MKGKSYSIPVGMAFKKYYCHYCESKLDKYRYHRVVTKGDKDYFLYQDIDTFPRVDQDVYSYHFKCGNCNKLISVEHQYAIEIIQKQLKSKRLSEIEIKENYNQAKEKQKKRRLIGNIILPLIFLFITFLITYLFLIEKSTKNLIILSIIYLLITLMIIWSAIYNFKGKRLSKYHMDYSYEEKALYKKLHTYSYNNKQLIQKSNECYCFHCESKINAKEIVSFIDNDKTALCPLCNVDAIIPDCIEEEITKELIDEMKRFWF